MQRYHGKIQRKSYVPVQKVQGHPLPHVMRAKKTFDGPPPAGIENELCMDCGSPYHVSEHPLAHNPQGGIGGNQHHGEEVDLNPGTYMCTYIYIYVYIYIYIYIYVRM